MAAVNKIHYIWMGSLIPYSYIGNIFHILVESSYEIYIWTDQPEKNKLKFLDVIGQYNTLIRYRKDYLAKLKFISIFDLERWIINNDIINNLTSNQLEILKESFILEYPNYSDYNFSKYNLDVIKKVGNFATLSDILRLIILYKEGGIYIDCDNTFRTQEIKKNNINSQFKFLKLLDDKLYSDQSNFGNSVLACNQGSIGCLSLLLYF